MFVLIIVETSSLHIVSFFFFPVIAIANMWSAATDATSGVSNVLKCIIKNYTFSAGILAYPVGIGFSLMFF